MSRAQNFTSTAAWPKSKPGTVRYLKGLETTERSKRTMASLQSRFTAELKASGLENSALKVGDRAPEFSLFNRDHVKANFAELLHRGPIVVSFFPGHW
jgi:hypothetical protein